MKKAQFSFVLETPAAEPEDAQLHFASKLTLEIDAWDLITDIERGRSDFVVIDTRSPAEVEARRIAIGQVDSGDNCALAERQGDGHLLQPSRL